MSDDTRELTVRESIDSKFRYVLLVAERAEQLMRGARAKLDISGAKPTHVAREEIDQRVVDWDYGLAPEPELEALIEEPVEEGEEEAAEAEESEDAEAEVH
jgi:DNA-directed RNA polymerase subunit K/omega